MSFPTVDTVFGQILYKNKQYDLLCQPLDETHFNILRQYKKENNCGVSSAPWAVNEYKWTVRNNKIYLTSIKCRLCKNQENLINEVFDTDIIFASWVTEDVKLVVSKKKSNVSEYKITMEREVLILTFENGILKHFATEVEQYQIINLK